MGTPNHEWAVDYDTCDRCADFATHRLYWGDELMHQYCSLCLGVAQNEHEELWREIVDTAAMAICAEARDA